MLGSVILPGLGQMMNGQAAKGFAFMGMALFLLFHHVTLFSPFYVLIAAAAAADASLARPSRRNYLRTGDDLAA